MRALSICMYLKIPFRFLLSHRFVSKKRKTCPSVAEKLDFYENMSNHFILFYFIRRVELWRNPKYRKKKKENVFARVFNESRGSVNQRLITIPKSRSMINEGWLTSLLQTTKRSYYVTQDNLYSSKTAVSFLDQKENYSSSRVHTSRRTV